MNIFLINEQENLTDVIVKNKHIVEFYDVIYKNEKYKKIYIYNPKLNTKQEVLPKTKKRDFVTIIDAVWNSNYLYYSTYSTASDNTIKIKIHKYDIENGTDIVLYSFKETKELLDSDKKLKIFILNDTNILIQSELKKEHVSGNMMGHIEFSQVLVNLENNDSVQLIEANFINNGINTIIPVSESLIMIKTGYSYLEDDRFERSSESEALIESVFLTTTAKLLADITLMSESMDMEMISSAYFVRHLSKPQVTGKYIHFDIIDINKGFSTCIFYDTVTGETKEYENPIINSDDLYFTYVINDIPYVRINKTNGVDFFNLKNIEIDVSFYDESFVDQVGRLFIVTKKSFGKVRTRIYKYPNLNLILDDTFKYQNSCVIDNDYYIYCTSNSKGKVRSLIKKSKKKIS